MRKLLVDTAIADSHKCRSKSERDGTSSGMIPSHNQRARSARAAAHRRPRFRILTQLARCIQLLHLRGSTSCLDELRILATTSCRTPNPVRFPARRQLPLLIETAIIDGHAMYARQSALSSAVNSALSGPSAPDNQRSLLCPVRIASGHINGHLAAEYGVGWLVEHHHLRRIARIRHPRSPRGSRAIPG